MLASVYQHLERKDQAAAYAEKAYTFLIGIDKPKPRIVSSICALAETFHWLGNDAKASLLYDHALELNRDRLGDNNEARVGMLIAFARLNSSSNPGKAEDLFKQAISVAKHLNDPVLGKTASDALANFHHQSN
jgi:hypothetical protein